MQVSKEQLFGKHVRMMQPQESAESGEGTVYVREKSEI